MAQQTTAPAVDSTWTDAVDLAARLLAGQAPPPLELGGLPAGECATLEAGATYQQRAAPGPGRGWVDVAAADLVVTDRRILVGHPHRGLLSLWHLDLENLQLGRSERDWHLDLHPVGINPRVRLTGEAAPLVAVHLARAVFPATWSRLSGLLPVLDAAA